MKHYHLLLCKKIFLAGILLLFMQMAEAQDTPMKRFLNLPSMKGASCSFMVKDISNGKVVYSYTADREVIPASVLKLVTTATALELLGEEFRFETSLEYDGKITGGVLEGNLYIKGSGDPTLGSSHFAADRSRYTPDQNTFMPQWITALKKAGITKVTGSVIADESIFDTEGVSAKWVFEDMGNYYGAGCYGLSVFDNLYKLYVSSGSAGSKPQIIETVPPMPNIHFHNYLVSSPARSDSCYILGAPFSNDRFLYGTIPANKERFLLRGDIPEPPLFLAQYVSAKLGEAGIPVTGAPTCYRILSENNNRPKTARKKLASVYSPTLREIVRIVNERSHNLYADALLKTIGLHYTPTSNETLSSAGRGIKMIESYWGKKGLDLSSLWMYDGSGLAIANKLTASFTCDLLTYMEKKSGHSKAFTASLPKAGMEGSVAGFLKGTVLQGKLLLKSGGMSRVRSYAGYLIAGERKYAVTIIVNNYNGEGRLMIKNMEDLFLALFLSL